MGREVATDSAYHSFHESEVRTTRRSYRGWWIAALTIGGLQSLALLQVVQQQNSLVTQLTSRPKGWTQLTSEGYSANIGIHGTTHVPLVDKPKKLLLGGLTPTADQHFRGDCWLFSVMGVLEDSYHRYGVERGWLAPGVYVRLSRQAFGIRVMEQCRLRPSIMCPVKATSTPDGYRNPILWGNTTEGADERMLYFMKSLADSALPDAVCKYTDTNAGESKCDGLDKALQSNPLRFNVTSADMLYEPVDIQRALLQKQRVLTIGLLMVVNEYYLPCTAETASHYRCSPGNDPRCVPCPIERAYGSVVSGGGCCIAVHRPMVSMRGEWHHRHRGKMILLGGHAIGIVGYSDEYTDEWGNRGGFIIRNSWSDGLGTAHGSSGRGSHTAAYYMRDIDDADEALACPNPHSPRSWSTCKSLDDCHNPVTALEARAQRRPLTLRCVDNSADLFGICTKNATYFMTNLTEWDEDGLFVACFLWAGEKDAPGHGDVCAPPMLIDDLASILTPAAIEHFNDPDLCGYNFLPYATLDKLRSRFGGNGAGDFNIEWSQASYASQKNGGKFAGGGKIATLDYSLLQSSTHVLPTLGRAGLSTHAIDKKGNLRPL